MVIEFEHSVILSPQKEINDFRYGNGCNFEPPSEREVANVASDKGRKETARLTHRARNKQTIIFYTRGLLPAP